MADGKRCSGSIPYGFYRLPGDKQTLIVDPVAAEVIRKIFTLADEGNGASAIAKILTEERVLIPSAYTLKYHPEQNNHRTCIDEYSWNRTTVNDILSRQEYLGHTVLKKSVCMNFKTNKRRSASEDELLIFPNTHEAIISQELWDSVQKKRKRCPRTTPAGTYKHRLSGYLFCADCGTRLALQAHKKRNSDDVYYTFRCSAYGQKTKTCTAHYVNADAIEQLLLTSIQRLSKYVIENERDFAEQLKIQYQARSDEKPEKGKMKLKELQKRYNELSVLVRGIYENYAVGKLPERQYRQLLNQYDAEQGEIETEIEKINSELETSQQKPVQTDKFINIIRKYKEPSVVTDTMLREFVDKIVVYQAEGGKGKNRSQRIDIYFNFIGQFELAFSDEEILAENKRLKKLAEEKEIKQRKRNQAYRDKQKAKRYAENDGHKFPQRSCSRCGKEFWPTSNRQIYCCEECKKEEYTERKKAKRHAEKGEHIFKQKACILCGKLFWPSNGQEVLCSEECKSENRRKKQLAYYHSVYSDREKAKRQAEKEKIIAENGGCLYAPKVCEYCDKAFNPTKQQQKYCSEKCSRNAYEMKNKGRDPSEKEGHKYYKRVCTVCGKEYWPHGPNDLTCSSECRHNRILNRHRENYIARKESVGMSV